MCFSFDPRHALGVTSGRINPLIESMERLEQRVTGKWRISDRRNVSKPLLVDIDLRAKLFPKGSVDVGRGVSNPAGSALAVTGFCRPARANASEP